MSPSQARGRWRQPFAQVSSEVSFEAVGYFELYARTPCCILPHFCPPTFPMFEPNIQKWVIFLRRLPCVSDTFRFESPPLHGKKIEFGTFPLLSLPPPPKRRGAKQYSPCFLRRRRRPKAGDAFTRTRFMPTFGGCSAERPAEGPKVGCFGV